MDLKEAALLGDRPGEHWYYRAKAEALDRVVGPGPVARVLDVGSGMGFFARHLLERGAGKAVCVDPGYDRDHDEVHDGSPLLFRRESPNLPSDLVLMMDVLEHVDDDHALLSAHVARAAPGTRFIITVPAFQWMWSQHDDFLEHRRRYTLPGIEAVMRCAGLRVEGGRYLYGGLLPVAAALRLPERLQPKVVTPQSQMRPVSAFMNAALLGVCRAEALLPGNRVAGLTAMAWGRVPG